MLNLKTKQTLHPTEFFFTVTELILRKCTKSPLNNNQKHYIELHSVKARQKVPQRL